MLGFGRYAIFRACMFNLSSLIFLASQVPPLFHRVPVSKIMFVYSPYLFFVGKARAASLKRSSETSGLLKKANSHQT